MDHEIYLPKMRGGSRRRGAAWRILCAACVAAAGCGGGGGGGGSGGPQTTLPPMPLAGGTAAFLNTTAMTDTGDDAPDGLSFGTDGNGTWIAVWRWSALPLNVGEDSEILLARSFDNGTTWSDPELLDPNAVLETVMDAGADIATDRTGTWLVAWQALERGPQDTSVVLLTSRSTDNGATWSPSSALDPSAAFPTTDSAVRLATDEAGRWVAGWVRSEQTGMSDYPTFVISAFSDDAGMTWSAPVELSGDLDGDYSGPQLATDGAGTWIAVWTSLDTVDLTRNSIFMSRSVDNGASWTVASAISPGGRGAPRLATDEVGHWVVAFASTDDFGGSDSDIGVIRSADNGVTWTRPVPLNSDASVDFVHSGLFATDFFVDVATNGLGRWVVVWQHNETGTVPQGVDIDVAVSESIDNGATWSPQLYLNPDALDDDPRTGDLVPTIVSDGGDRWIAAWCRQNLLGISSGTDMDLMYSTDFVEGLH